MSGLLSLVSILFSSHLCICIICNTLAFNNPIEHQYNDTVDKIQLLIPRYYMYYSAI